MLKNVNMYKIVIDEEYGAFLGRWMKNFQVGIMLTQFVLMSQERGEWVTETTFREFVTNFHGMQFFMSPRDFCQWVIELEAEGYISIEMGKTDADDDILRVTEKFAELCEEECA